MRTIYKYTISNTPDVITGVNLEGKIYVPADSKILCCKVQNGTDVCVWVELEKSAWDDAKVPIQQITIKLFGTGWNMDCLKDKKYEYLDSIYIGKDGLFVYHVYAIYD
jgi:hypothetical protein